MGEHVAVGEKMEEDAGMNWPGGANERVDRERPSQPLGPDSYADD